MEIYQKEIIKVETPNSKPFERNSVIMVRGYAVPPGLDRVNVGWCEFVVFSGVGQFCLIWNIGSPYCCLPNNDLIQKILRKKLLAEQFFFGK